MSNLLLFIWLIWMAILRYNLMAMNYFSSTLLRWIMMSSRMTVKQYVLIFITSLFILLTIRYKFYGTFQIYSHDHAVYALCSDAESCWRLSTGSNLSNVKMAVFDDYRRKLISTEINENTDKLPLCKILEEHLIGPIEVQMMEKSVLELERKYPYVGDGGQWRPLNCRNMEKLAVIVPFRNRWTHFYILLNNLHVFLQSQQLDYRIFLVEQDGNEVFNKGIIMNAGYKHLQLHHKEFNCFVFHDVDLLPEDNRNLYQCDNDQPRHLSVAVDKFNYELPYNNLIGGVIAFTKEQFVTVNGFSNVYWGWGGEDDDITKRVQHHQYKVSRYSHNIARYKMISHQRDNDNPINPIRFKLLLRASKRYATDGLNNVNYTLVNTEIHQLYTKLLINIGKMPSAEELLSGFSNFELFIEYVKSLLFYYG